MVTLTSDVKNVSDSVSIPELSEKQNGQSFLQNFTIIAISCLIQEPLLNLKPVYPTIQSGSLEEYLLRARDLYMILLLFTQPQGRTIRFLSNRYLFPLVKVIGI